MQGMHQLPRTSSKGNGLIQTINNGPRHELIATIVRYGTKWTIELAAGKRRFGVIGLKVTIERSIAQPTVTPILPDSKLRPFRFFRALPRPSAFACVNSFSSVFFWSTNDSERHTRPVSSSISTPTAYTH